MRAEADGHRLQALKSGLIYGLPLLWARGCNPHADMGTAPAVAQKIKGVLPKVPYGVQTGRIRHYL